MAIRQGSHVWDFYNHNANRWFEFHDMAIPWTDGQLVRLKIAVDISLRKDQELQQINLKCLSTL